MLENILNITADEFGQAAIQGVLGQIVTFLGIVLLIVILSIVAAVLKKTAGNGKSEEKAKAPENQVKPAPDRKPERSRYAVEAKETEEVPAEVKAAIIAAISAYYEAEKPRAEFTVKRIKRI